MVEYYNKQKELKNIESKLKSLEFDKNKLEAQFHDTALDQDQINTLSSDLQKIIAAIEAKIKNDNTIK